MKTRDDLIGQHLELKARVEEAPEWFKLVADLWQHILDIQEYNKAAKAAKVEPRGDHA